MSPWLTQILLIHGSILLCLKLALVTVSDDHCAAQLSCACLNARSVLECFDMFAFVLSFHIDILAVTVIFWMVPLAMDKLLNILSQPLMSWCEIW